jgi:hypothetical protein
MMGIWFAANAIANYLADIQECLLVGSTIPLYWFLVGSSLGAGVLLLLITRCLNTSCMAKADSGHVPPSGFE